MTDLPDEAVEAAARAFDAAEYDDPDSVTEAEWAAVSDAEREFYLSAARRALTAAAPHIAAQATADPDHWAHAAIAAQDAALTAQINEAVKWGREKDAELADLRAGIEALRDEWRGARRTVGLEVLIDAAKRDCADALDALLRGA